MSIQLLRPVATAALVLTLAACSSGGDGNSDNTIDGGGPGSGGGNQNSNSNFGNPNQNEDQIRPGVRVTANGSSCTSNFIYGDSAGNFYIGAAAHCFSPDSNRGIDACNTANLAIGTSVGIQNAVHDGTLIYSSWRSMQDNGETPGSNACTYNDFALVRIDSRDHDNIHPAAIAFEGPRGLLRGGANVGDRAYSYGQSSSHQGIRSNQEKDGPIRSVRGNGWQYGVEFDNPGLPGDSGSAVLHETGNALGVLTVVSAGASLTPVSNGVMSLEMGLDYANDVLSPDVSLVTWSRFTP